MRKMALLTSDLTIQSWVEQVIVILEGHLTVVGKNRFDVVYNEVDLIFWYTHPFNSAEYQYLKQLCPRIMWLMDRQYRHQRLGDPTYQPVKVPCLAMFAYCDPDDVAYIIDYHWNNYPG